MSSQGTAIELAAISAAAAATSSYPQNEPGEPDGFSQPQQKQSQQSGTTIQSAQQMPGMAGGSNTLPHSHTWNPQQIPVAGFPSLQSLDMQNQVRECLSF